MAFRLSCQNRIIPRPTLQGEIVQTELQVHKQKKFYFWTFLTFHISCLFPDNVKALFRRAKAHVGAWNPVEAKADFKRATELDHSLEKSVNKELQRIDVMQKKKDQEDKDKLKGLFAS